MRPDGWTWPPPAPRPPQKGPGHAPRRLDL